jgi:hypothetical protein
MAAVPATLRAVQIIQGPFDQPTNGANWTDVIVYIDPNGAAVTSAVDTLDLTGAGAAISGFIRDGRTYTPRNAALYQPFRTGTTNVFGPTVITGGTVRLTPTLSDFATDTGIAASAPVNAPFGILVGCVVT